MHHRIREARLSDNTRLESKHSTFKAEPCAPIPIHMDDNTNTHGDHSLNLLESIQPPAMNITIGVQVDLRPIGDPDPTSGIASDRSNGVGTESFVYGKSIKCIALQSPEPTLRPDPHTALCILVQSIDTRFYRTEQQGIEVPIAIRK